MAYTTYAFLHDPPEGSLEPAFGSLGLRSNDDATVRPVDAAWQDRVQAALAR